MAEQMSDSVAKQAMLEIAERYEHIATRAEAAKGGGAWVPPKQDK